MKNFKAIVSLVALIAISNAYVATTKAASYGQSYPDPDTISMFSAGDYYNDDSGLLTQIGVEELVKNVKEKYPALTGAKLNAAVYKDAVEYLKPLRRGIKSETLNKSEAAELNAMINKAAPKVAVSAKKATTTKKAPVKKAPVKKAPVKKAPAKGKKVAATLTEEQIAKRAQVAKDNAAIAKAKLEAKKQKPEFTKILAAIDSNKALVPAQQTAINKNPKYKSLLEEIRPNFDLVTFTMTFPAQAPRLIGVEELQPGFAGPAREDAYGDAASIFYNLKTKTLKADGVKEYVAMVKAVYPAMSNLELTEKTYSDASAILRAVINPMVPSAITMFDKLCVNLKKMIGAAANSNLTSVGKVVSSSSEMGKAFPELINRPITVLEEQLAKAARLAKAAKEQMAGMASYAVQGQQLGLTKAAEQAKSAKQMTADLLKSMEPDLQSVDKTANAPSKMSKASSQLMPVSFDEIQTESTDLTPEESAVMMKPSPRKALPTTAKKTVAPFTPILKELETIPMSESGYDETPTSFSSTVGIIPEPVVKTQKVSLGAMELGQAKLPLSDDVTRFIEESKQQGINSKTMDQDWLLKAVQHILNGKLTRDNKAATLQKLFEVADAVVGVPLRADTTITDDEYDKIAGAMDRRINNFMSKLVVGSDYDLQWVK